MFPRLINGKNYAEELNDILPILHKHIVQYGYLAG